MPVWRKRHCSRGEPLVGVVLHFSPQQDGFVAVLVWRKHQCSVAGATCRWCQRSRQSTGCSIHVLVPPLLLQCAQQLPALSSEVLCLPPSKSHPPVPCLSAFRFDHHSLPDYGFFLAGSPGTSVDTSTVQRVSAPFRDIYVVHLSCCSQFSLCFFSPATSHSCTRSSTNPPNHVFAFACVLPSPTLGTSVDTSTVQRVSAPTRDIYVERTKDGDRVFAGFGRPSQEYCDCFLDPDKLPEDIIKVCIAMLEHVDRGTACVLMRAH